MQAFHSDKWMFYKTTLTLVTDQIYMSRIPEIHWDRLKKDCGNKSDASNKGAKFIILTIYVMYPTPLWIVEAGF